MISSLSYFREFHGSLPLGRAMIVVVVVVAPYLIYGPSPALSQSMGGPSSAPGYNGGSVSLGVPAPAAAVGYDILTYRINNFTTTNVDIAKLNPPAKQMYIWNYFALDGTAEGIVFNADGSLTITGTNNAVNYGQLSTAAQNRDPNGG